VEHKGDAGAPTYFRYPVQETWTGSDSEPGNAYAVLYSLQQDELTYNDFKTYRDTEVLIATDGVMNWLTDILQNDDEYVMIGLYDPVLTLLGFIHHDDT